MELLFLGTSEISFKHELQEELLTLKSVVICVHLISSVLMLLSCVHC